MSVNQEYLVKKQCSSPLIKSSTLELEIKKMIFRSIYGPRTSNFGSRGIYILFLKLCFMNEIFSACFHYCFHV